MKYQFLSHLRNISVCNFSVKLEKKKEKTLKVIQSHLILCNSEDYGPPGSSVHGILQAGTLKQIAILFSRGSS